MTDIPFTMLNLLCILEVTKMSQILLLNNYSLERDRDIVLFEKPVEAFAVLGYYEYYEPGIEVFDVTEAVVDGMPNHGWDIKDLKTIDGGISGVVTVGRTESVQFRCKVHYHDWNDQDRLNYGQHPRDRYHRFAVTLTKKIDIREYSKTVTTANELKALEPQNKQELLSVK